MFQFCGAPSPIRRDVIELILDRDIPKLAEAARGSMLPISIKNIGVTRKKT